MKPPKNQRFCRSLFFFLFSFFFVPCSFLFGLDFTLIPNGFVFIPTGEGSADPASGDPLYDIGGGGELGFEIDLSTIWPNPLGLGYTF